MEKTNGSFYKTLTFQREKEGDKEKIAEFIDKFGKDAKVVTTWGGIIPGLKYSCQLEGTDEKDDEKKVFIYKLLKFRLWIDKLAITSIDRVVRVTLDNKEVENLTFDCKDSTDFEEKVGELKEYFHHKEFQLSGKEEIASFVNSYRKSCKDLYESSKKEIINREKRKRKSNSD
jgi:hypothetical protein